MNSGAVSPLVILQAAHKLAKMRRYSRISSLKYCGFSKYGVGKRRQRLKITQVKISEPNQSKSIFISLRVADF